MKRSNSALSQCCALLAVLSIFSSSSRAQDAVETVIARFSGESGTASAQPQHSLIQAQDGNFYGVTFGPGSAGYPGVFQVTPSGKLTFIYTFTDAAEGGGPSGALTQGPDGNLYGVTYAEGASGYGTVYKLTPGGQLTNLYEFTGETDGGRPSGSLILGTDGNFYGTTQEGGPCTPDNSACGQGSVYRISPAGKFTPLLGLMPSTTEGNGPIAGLLQASDGNFYGVTPAGGANGYGTIFRTSPAEWTYTNLYSFTQAAANNPTTPAPWYSLVQAADDNLYGDTTIGGGTADDGGMFFRVTTSGDFTLLYAFLNNNDGFEPNDLFLAGDGNIYTTTRGGNPTDLGSALSLSTAGVPTLLFDFENDSTGGSPQGGFVQANDGLFYSTGGSAIFKLAPATPVAPPVQLVLSPATVLPNSPVTLSWSVSNAFSLTMQQCYAFVQNGAASAGTWTGKQSGVYKSSTRLFTGSSQITPTAAGAYTYALTCGGIESGFATLSVGAPAAPSLAASPNPAMVGQTVALTATVSGSGAIPTGNVSFYYGSFLLGAKSLKSGSATLTASTSTLPPGTYGVTAKYTGDSTYAPSTSPSYSVTLGPAATATTLTANPTSVTPPATVILSAQVARSASGSTGHPTGKVTFFYKTEALGTAIVNSSGLASITASSSGIPAGSYEVVAKYSGDASDTASDSAPVTVSVK